MKRSYDLEPLLSLHMAGSSEISVHKVLLAHISVNQHLPASVRFQKCYISLRLSLTKQETKEGFQRRKYCVSAEIVIAKFEFLEACDNFKRCAVLKLVHVGYWALSWLARLTARVLAR